MGNTQGGESKSLTGQKLIDILNARSMQGNSDSPNTVTYKGMSMYLNQEVGQSLNWNPSHPIERLNRYHDVRVLVDKIGMSEDAGGKLMAQAYKSLNGRDGTLEKANIEDPAKARNTRTATISNDNNASGHDKEDTHGQDAKIVEKLKDLLSNPHSYLSLSGEKLESLLQKEPGKLKEAILADTTFVEKTKGYWNLPQTERQETAKHVRQSYNEELCTDKLHLAGPSNRTPIENFLKGKDVAINAVEQGFDIYNRGEQHALEAFGTAAIGVNNAINSGHTLAGRGADTFTEQTMLYSPDGHSNSNPKTGPKHN